MRSATTARRAAAAGSHALHTPGSAAGGSPAAAAPAKPCFFCGRDCAHEPRQRDVRGVYAHIACAKLASANQTVLVSDATRWDGAEDATPPRKPFSAADAASPPGFVDVDADDEEPDGPEDDDDDDAEGAVRALWTTPVTKREWGQPRTPGTAPRRIDFGAYGGA